MTFSTKALCALVAAFSPLTTANATSYDDCILAHMAGTQNKEAAYAIERACISNVSGPIFLHSSLNELASVGMYNTGRVPDPKYGMVVHLENTSRYALTEITIAIYNKASGKKQHNYIVSDFNAPVEPNTLITGLGEPVLTKVISPGETRTFYVPIEEGSDNPNTFSERFGWGIKSLRGFLATASAASEYGADQKSDTAPRQPPQFDDGRS